MSGPQAGVRDATESDAAVCAQIYAPYVTGTAITFESEPPAAAEMVRRIATARSTHAWVVLEQEGRVVGYAYGGRFAPRDAYRWSCEVSVYMELDRRRTGGGRALYESLFARLAARGYRTAAAGMTLPNEASAGLHRALGFKDVGTFKSIGFKHGKWHDVAWLQRSLTADDGPPAEPR
jgi:L-amino acid N-acyltransferase YncA